MSVRRVIQYVSEVHLNKRKTAVFAQVGEMKHLELVSVMCFAFSLLNAAHSRPDGAPQAACNRIFPQHGTYKSQSLDRILFSLNISQLTSGGGYRPGKTYNCETRSSRVVSFILLSTHSRGCIFCTISFHGEPACISKFSSTLCSDTLRSSGVQRITDSREKQWNEPCR